MKRQAQLDQEKFEGEMNEQELRNIRERNIRLRMEKKQFTDESLKVGREKKMTDLETEGIFAKQEVQ